MVRTLSALSDTAPHLLVVDDDRRIRDLLLRFLLAEGYRVTTAETAVEARRTAPDAAVGVLTNLRDWKSLELAGAPATVPSTGSEARVPHRTCESARRALGGSPARHGGGR